jgi:hypothetical protein
MRKRVKPFLFSFVQIKYKHREMAQVRILTDRGSVAYFLPESEKKGEPNKRYPDMVLDGTVL